MTIEVTWYNHTTDTAGSFLTDKYHDAINHAVASLRQGSDVEIRDHLTGVKTPPNNNPSQAILCTLRQLLRCSIKVDNRDEKFPLGVTKTTLWCAVAGGLAQTTRPCGDSRIVHLTDAGRALVSEDSRVIVEHKVAAQ